MQARSHHAAGEGVARSREAEPSLVRAAQQTRAAGARCAGSKAWSA
jgi:hypothetical protein